MTPITRAIIVLDQTSGSLREDDGRILGIDLAPSLQDPSINLSGVEILVAIPGADEPMRYPIACTPKSGVPTAAKVGILRNALRRAGVM